MLCSVAAAALLVVSMAFVAHWVKDGSNPFLPLLAFFLLLVRESVQANAVEDDETEDNEEDEA